MFVSALFYAIAGYFLGSILFARVFGRLFGRGDVTKDSKDGNPGTANAFQYGGFWCGVLTMCGDMAKGFLPVFLFMQLNHPTETIAAALVIAAPVIGHIFPIFFHFKGGKGIATTFGCLLGLLPEFYPVAALALPFLFFSAILRVSPHLYRTVLTYVCAVILMFFLNVGASIWLGFFIITLVVLFRLLTSPEPRQKLQVKLLWMR